MEKLTISNKYLTAEISTLGAELKSLRHCGEEWLWSGDKAVWSGQAPILFPICGALSNDKFIYENREYFLPKHGFIRRLEFEIEKADKTSATFLFVSNKETRKIYPFDFEFRASFSLCESSLSVCFCVKNTGHRPMPYALGSHEAYSCPHGIEEWSVEFEKREEFKRIKPCGSLLTHEKEQFAKGGYSFDLKNEYFYDDAIILEDIVSRKLCLKNRRTSQRIDIDFCGNDYLLIWTKPCAEFICIEPWSALPDFTDSDNRLENKKGIITLSPSECREHLHTITLSK